MAATVPPPEGALAAPPTPWPAVQPAGLAAIRATGQEYTLSHWGSATVPCVICACPLLSGTPLCLVVPKSFVDVLPVGLVPPSIVHVPGSPMVAMCAPCYAVTSLTAQNFPLSRTKDLSVLFRQTIETENEWVQRGWTWG